jgi:dGTPase
VERLEQRRRADGAVVLGLNLTWEVRDGIGGHSKGLHDLKPGDPGTAVPATLEGQVVRLADRIAYVHHDTDDAVRAGLIEETDVPHDVTRVLGPTRGRWLEVIVRDLVTQATQQAAIELSEPVRDATNRLKDFLSDRVYFSPLAAREAARGRRMLELLFAYFTERPQEVPKEARDAASGEPSQRALCDFLAGMTDRYAIRKFSEVFVVQGLEGQ